MTKEEAAKLLPIIKAFSEGKTIEILIGDKWKTLSPYSSFDSDPSFYRIKPEPVLIPFTFETFPLNAWVRRRNNPKCCALVTFIEDTGVYSKIDKLALTYNYLLDNCEYTLDGKTWLPCGIVQNPTE